MSNSVTFPFLEPVVRQIVNFLDIRRAADFLDRSAAKIIEDRMLEPNSSSLVSLHAQKMYTSPFLLCICFGDFLIVVAAPKVVSYVHSYCRGSTNVSRTYINMGSLSSIQIILIALLINL